MSLIRGYWLAAVCTLGLLASATGVQAQAMKLLPADTEMVITFNLQQILKSDVVKSNGALLKSLKQMVDQQFEDKGVAKYFAKANFDLFRDLHSVTIAVPAGKDAQEGLILLEGNFQADKIEQAASEVTKEAGGTFKVGKIGGVNVFEVTPKDEKTMYVGIVGQKTMIACSTKAEFAGAVARVGAASAEFKSETFKTLLSTVSAKQSISIAATSAAMEKLSEKAPEGAGDQVKQAAAVLKELEGFSAAITIDKNIDFQVAVNTKEAKKAAEYAAVANLGVMALKGKVADMAKQDERFVPAIEVINSLRITTKESNLVVRGQVSFETLGKVLQNLPGVPQN